MILPTISAVLLAVVLPSICSADDHRLFPAAQLEVYNNYDDRKLGIVSLDTLKFEITTTSSSSSSSSSNNNSIDKILQPAITRFKHSIGKLPDFHEDYEVNPLNLPLKLITTVTITVRSDDTRLVHGVAEDYELSVSPDDNTNGIHLKSTTVFGILRGLESLGQLIDFGWMSASASPVFCIHDMPIYISDAPTYPYRGLLIDTSRHYLPLSLILDNLDAMAMNKLNVLHWHISDSQSFPFAIPSFPDLAYKGAYHPKRIYTVKDVQTVIEQAYLRGIRVIPEIDMPGHTAAIAKSHPEVMSYCTEPNEPINPTVPETYRFIEAIYNDLSDIFPDEFVHVGGDEVQFSEQCWLNSTTITKWMKDHRMNQTVELYEYFETRLLKIVSSFNKTPVVWQEVFNLNLTITPDTIIDVWKGVDKYTIQNATNMNYRVILSGCWYLDHLGDTWEKYYECDPRNFTGNRDLMIGGHASMWGEHVDASNFISRVWPRASAAAERLWTGDVSHGPAKTVADRIHKFRCRLVRVGFAAGPTRPGSCPTEVPYVSRQTFYDGTFHEPSNIVAF
jgi:hexosaminidase